MLELSVEEQLSIETTQLKKAAFIFRAINHTLRMEMLRLLHKNSKMTVTDLYIKLRLEQSVASQHLAILRRQGIVSTQRDGKNIYYSVNYARLNQLHSIAKELVG